MNTQNELFAELVKLKSENPHLDVIFMVRSSDVDDDFLHTEHKIEDINIEHVMRNDDAEIIGKLFIVNYLNNENLHAIKYRSIEDDTLCSEYGIKKAILVYTGAL